jgi:hypothetical protein
MPVERIRARHLGVMLTCRFSPFIFASTQALFLVDLVLGNGHPTAKRTSSKPTVCTQTLTLSNRSILRSLPKLCEPSKLLVFRSYSARGSLT